MDGETTQPERGHSFDGVLRRSCDVELRVLNEEERTVEVIASTETLDAHGDVIKQFWDLERYTKNPVALWNHNRFDSSPWSMGGSVRPEDFLPIGQSVKTEVKGSGKGKKLIAVVKFASEEFSPMAQKVFLGVKEGVLRAVSVGFRPGALTPQKNKAGICTHYEIGSEEVPNELREISFVPMGSNPDAVAKSIAFEREHLGRMAAEQEQRHAAARGSRETDDMAMTTEEQKALDTAKSEALASKAEATTAKSELATVKAEVGSAMKRAEAAEATVTALQAELKTAREQIQKTVADQGKALLDAMEGKKFPKPSRERFEKVLAAQGVEETKALLESLPDLAVTQPVVGPDGKPVAEKVAPPSTPTDEPIDGEKAYEAFQKALTSGTAAA